MRRLVVLSYLGALLLLSPHPTWGQSGERISLAQVEDMFASIRAKTNWNVDSALLWGYFFSDPSVEKLNLLAGELEKSGYRIVELTPVEEQSPSSFRLRVEKVEVHSPVSLNARDQEFYALTEKYSIASYDGMDVGPAPEAFK